MWVCAFWWKENVLKRLWFLEWFFWNKIPKPTPDSRSTGKAAQTKNILSISLLDSNTDDLLTDNENQPHQPV